jgi:regulator of ribonuclease activity A
MIKTTDLCDEYGDAVMVVRPMFRSYGGVSNFFGPISTLQVNDDNVLVKAALSEPGNGRVLVVDGGGSLRCALVGDLLASIGQRNGWAGIVVHGCIRDQNVIHGIHIGVMALATNPRRSAKQGLGARDIPVTFADVSFVPGHYLYADEDGIIVSEDNLLEPISS